MRLLVSGDRYWKWEDRHVILRAIEKLNPSIIIHGGAKGVDTIAGAIGRYLEIEVIVFPAEWYKYGKAAGSIRNEQMIIEGKPDYLLACHPCIQDSKGTKHMIERAKKYKIPYTLITGE